MTDNDTIHDVALDDIQPGPTIRSDPPDEDYLDLLVEVIDDWPPVVLQQDTYRIVDGTARIEAARRAGRTTIAARLVDVSDDDLFEERVARNRRHGQPLTRDERRAIAGQLLDRHPDWSNTLLGRAAGVSEKTIRTIRSRRSTPASAEVEPRVGVDGRTYRDEQTRKADEQRLRDLLAEHPEMSLNEIADLTGVPKTSIWNAQQRMRAEAAAGENTPTCSSIPEASDAGAGTATEPPAVEQHEATAADRPAPAASASAPDRASALRRVWRSVAGRIGRWLDRIRGWWRVRRSPRPARFARHHTEETT